MNASIREFQACVHALDMLPLGVDAVAACVFPPLYLLCRRTKARGKTMEYVAEIVVTSRTNRPVSQGPYGLIAVHRPTVTVTADSRKQALATLAAHYEGQPNRFLKRVIYCRKAKHV
jgi:hypothetical protein